MSLSDPVVGPFGGDVLARAASAVLTEYLPAWSVPAGLGKVATWDAVPTWGALQEATLPAGAIVVPGLSDAPTRSTDAYSATWRLGVGVYARGGSYSDTQANVARWAALVRTVIVASRNLGLPGVVQSVIWVGEDLTVVPNAAAARTLGGCAVAFDVIGPESLPLGLTPPTGSPSDPRVRELRPTVAAVPLPDPFPAVPVTEE